MEVEVSLEKVNFKSETAKMLQYRNRNSCTLERTKIVAKLISGLLPTFYLPFY